MKTLRLIISALSFIVMSACHHSDPPSADSIAVQKLEGTWKINGTNSVTLDGADISEYFDGFSINFLPSQQYTTTKTPGPIWHTDGGYEFKFRPSSTDFDLRIDNALDVTIMELSASTLKMQVQYQQQSGGRMSHASGIYIFTLTKK
jgi:hypothetical protein